MLAGFRNYEKETKDFNIWQKFLWLLGGIFTANEITVIRFVVALLLLYPWYVYPGKWMHFSILWLWGLCWFGDALDGGVARARNDSTDLGKVLDPIIDKLQFYITMLIYWQYLWIGPFELLFVLDVVSTILRGRARAGVVGAIMSGKIKTVCAVTSFFVIGIGVWSEFDPLIFLGNLILLAASMCASHSIYTRTRKS